MPVYETKQAADAALAAHREQITAHLANFIARMDDQQRIEFLERYRGRHGNKAADDILKRARQAWCDLRRSPG